MSSQRTTFKRKQATSAPILGANLNPVSAADAVLARRKSEAQRALGRASVTGDVEDVRKALEDGADVNAFVYKRTDGTMFGPHTAADIAAWHSQSEVLEVLLEQGADPHKGTSDGWTPLHMACTVTDCDDRTISVLLEKGADPNHNANDEQWTPLMQASYDGNTACIKSLYTETQRLYKEGKLLVKLLVNAVDNEGKTALDLARMPDARIDHNEAIDYLRTRLHALTGEQVLALLWQAAAAPTPGGETVGERSEE